ncbi:hypothetical protein P3X46_023566 [Hevea brasiliensis]|uniref:Uncharacterized protein n=1 Tax=Hevea brasiliensis TaxID=3981 RepID=A0ABQ9LBD9_HEVBR|nr:hypothetical protein P3X46_023566 [Hevea brasiliensis]
MTLIQFGRVLIYLLLRHGLSNKLVDFILHFLLSILCYFYVINQLLNEDIEALESLQSSFLKCVFLICCILLILGGANGLGLQVVTGSDNCQVSPFLATLSLNRDPKTGELEGLSFEFNLCEAVVTWEQVQNSTTILTREFIVALPNGWEDYAWHRFNKGILINHSQNKTLCTEKLSLVLPDTPPYEVPINIPVYLMLGASFGSAVKGIGLKALEFALYICESVDMYGFTVDPGYKEW